MGGSMVKISYNKLIAEAETTGFRPEILEKVFQLFGLLDTLWEHPYLKGKLVLKGGTALNLFVFEMPRLSVDIDLNYIGAEGLDEMLEDRSKIEKALQSVFGRQGFNVRRMPQGHAGGKWSLRYTSSFGEGGNLEVDLNFMYRIPLWDISFMDSKTLGPWKVSGVPVLDIHELAAGKLVALFARTKARDLFDSHKILSIETLDAELLRIGFLVYGAMSRKDWRTISIDGIKFDVSDLENQLLPTLHTQTIGSREEIIKYSNKLEAECRKMLTKILPFEDNELAFLNLVLDHGEIDPSLITSDSVLRKKIQDQPMLKWKARNVRQYKRLSKN
jgi:hypothetical protein